MGTFFSSFFGFDDTVGNLSYVAMSTVSNSRQAGLNIIREADKNQAVLTQDAKQAAWSCGYDVI
jgi:hypothetical protein